MKKIKQRPTLKKGKLYKTERLMLFYKTHRNVDNDMVYRVCYEKIDPVICLSDKLIKMYDSDTDKSVYKFLLGDKFVFISENQIRHLEEVDRGANPE